VLAEGPAGKLLAGAVCGGGEYCPGGPLDMLCIPILVERPAVPVGAAEDELSGLTSSQALAIRRIGPQGGWDVAEPRNRHSTCALSTRSTGDLQNLALPPVKRGLVQLRTPSLNVNVVLMEPGVVLMENSWLSTLRFVDT
jgi:hypothetical protein